MIDRDPQNLNIPIGGFDPVRRRRRISAWRKYWYSHAPTIVMGLGILVALLGGYLAVNRPPPEIGLLNGRVEVAGTVLISKANGVWSDGNSTLNIAKLPDGRTHGTFTSTANGKHVSGECFLVSQGNDLNENCTFNLDGKAYSSTDHFDPSTGIWQRTYSSGQKERVAIPADGSAIPLPFPIGL